MNKEESFSYKVAKSFFITMSQDIDNTLIELKNILEAKELKKVNENYKSIRDIFLKLNQQEKETMYDFFKKLIIEEAPLILSNIDRISCHYYNNMDFHDEINTEGDDNRNFKLFFAEDEGELGEELQGNLSDDYMDFAQEEGYFD